MKKYSKKEIFLFLLIIIGLIVLFIVYLLSIYNLLIWLLIIPFVAIILIVSFLSILVFLKRIRTMKKLNRLRNVFLASISHELRTPLTSIIGFTRMILKGRVGEINEEQEKQLNIIMNSANHLQELINDIIDLSRIEADKLDIRKERFDLIEEFMKLREIFLVAAENKGLDIYMDVPENLPIVNDKKRINQILVNLIGNAIKFTDKGRISVKIQESNTIVKISVEDTGPGIKEVDLKKLFKPFRRIIDPGKKVEGTGLGLYFSKKLAILLGGDISVKSEFGKGSTFTLVLKLINDST